MRISAGGARDFDNRNNSISGDDEAVTNMSNMAERSWAERMVKTVATVLESSVSC